MNTTDKLAHYINENFLGLTAEPGDGAVYINLNCTETDLRRSYDPDGLIGLEMIVNAVGNARPVPNLRVRSGLGGPLYFVLEADDDFINTLARYAIEFT